jgi:hypothetical protein
LRHNATRRTIAARCRQFAATQHEAGLLVRIDVFRHSATATATAIGTCSSRSRRRRTHSMARLCDIDNETMTACDDARRTEIVVVGGGERLRLVARAQRHQQTHLRIVRPSVSQSQHVTHRHCTHFLCHLRSIVGSMHCCRPAAFCRVAVRQIKCMNAFQ